MANFKKSNLLVHSGKIGKKYYFRIRAVNNQGESGWSNTVSVVLGKAPAAPTTWSSTTTAIVGEPIILYWTHNAEDGSKEKYAKVIEDGINAKNEKIASNDAK